MQLSFLGMLLKLYAEDYTERGTQPTDFFMILSLRQQGSNGCVFGEFQADFELIAWLEVTQPVLITLAVVNNAGDTKVRQEQTTHSISLSPPHSTGLNSSPTISGTKWAIGEGYSNGVAGSIVQQ